MNDNELITAVRQQRTKVEMTVPVEQIIRRGQAVRARRRIPALAGALAVVTVAAVAAVALTALVSSGRPARQQPAAQLAAWTVVKLANGNVYVTIRELRNPAGLQRKLRADGIPASVTFAGQQNPACRPYSPPSARATQQVISPYRGVSRRYTVLVIHPSKLPSHAGVLIAADHVQTLRQAHVAIALLIGLVRTSGRCAGS